MRFLSNSLFEESYYKIKKKTKHYSCIERVLIKEILSVLEIKPKKILFSVKDKICLKCDLRSCTNNGSSYGFRIIVLIDTASETCYFLQLYPKYGPLSGDNVSAPDAHKIIETTIAPKLNELKKVTVEDDKIVFNL